MEVILDAQGVSKSYDKKFAVKDADLTIRRGEILGLLGPNGAGKTTLIKIMATLLKKDSGTVNIFGYDIDKDENRVRHLFGYVGQDTERSAYARLTPLENLRFFGALRGLKREDVDDTVWRLVEQFSMDESILHKQFMHLSGGQKQVVVIMRSLLHDPLLVFLDEPTKGLDPIAANSIRKFLKTYVNSGEKSLLLTSHILNEVDLLADRCSLINKGSIAITDTPENLKHSVGVNDFIEMGTKVPNAVVEKIRGLDAVVSYKLKETNNGKAHSFGVDDLFEGMEGVIKVMRESGVKEAIKPHSISLEDAFIHYVGSFKDEEANGK